MGAAVGIGILVASAVFLRGYFRWALLDVHNLTTMPKPWVCWLLALSVTLAVVLALGLAPSDQLRTAQFFGMAALATVVSPAIADPIKFSESEISDSTERFTQNLEAKASEAVAVKVVTLFGAFLSSLLWEAVWLYVLAILGMGLLSGRLYYFSVRVRYSKAYQRLDLKERVGVQRALLLRSILLPIGYAVWVLGAGTAIDEINGIDAKNWNGYVGVVLGVILSLMPQWMQRWRAT